jgi:flagellar basal-body rod protein FlgC
MAEIPGFGDRAFNGLRGLLRPLAIPMSALTAYRRRIEVIATNIANVDSVAGPNGPYRRQVAVLERQQDGGVQVARVAEDPSAFISEYDPGHPNADELGYVQRPNVDLNNEVADLMIARRMFEANATVFEAAKAMLRRALDI